MFGATSFGGAHLVWREHVIHPHLAEADAGDPQADQKKGRERLDRHFRPRGGADQLGLEPEPFFGVLLHFFVGEKFSILPAAKDHATGGCAGARGFSRKPEDSQSAIGDSTPVGGRPTRISTDSRAATLAVERRWTAPHPCRPRSGFSRWVRAFCVPSGTLRAFTLPASRA